MKTKNEEKSAVSVISLVLGIISIMTALFWYITLPTGILAIIFGAKSYKQTKRKLSLAGMITGIVGVSIFAFIYISLIILLILSNRMYWSKNASMKHFLINII